MAESREYRMLNVHQGGDTMYVIDDSGKRPMTFGPGSDIRLADYLNELTKEGWEVSLHIPGNNVFSTLVLQKRS